MKPKLENLDYLNFVINQCIWGYNYASGDIIMKRKSTECKKILCYDKLKYMGMFESRRKSMCIQRKNKFNKNIHFSTVSNFCKK